MAKKRKDRDSSPDPRPATSAEHPLHQLMIGGDNRAARSLALQTLEQAEASEQERSMASDVVARIGCDRAILAAGLAAASVVASMIVLLYLV